MANGEDKTSRMIIKGTRQAIKMIRLPFSSDKTVVATFATTFSVAGSIAMSITHSFWDQCANPYINHHQWSRRHLN